MLGDMLQQALGCKTQAWVAARCGVSQPAVSQWLNNKTVPDRSQLALLVLALDLDVDEAARAAGYQVEEIQSILSSIAVPFSDITYAKKQIRHLYKARLMGKAPLTIEMADNFLPALKSMEKRTYGTRLYQELLRLHAETLYERAIAYLEIIPGKLPDVTDIRVAELRKIAELSKDEEVYGLFRAISGSVHYVNEAYDNAIYDFREAASLVKPPDYQLYALRALALSLGYRHVEPEFLAVEKRVRKIIESGHVSHLEHICYALEGLSRGRGNLGFSNAFAIWDEGWDICLQILARNEDIPLRLVQFKRSKVDTLRQLLPDDKTSLQRYGTEGILLAQEKRYPRYVKLLEEVLNTSL